MSAIPFNLIYRIATPLILTFEDFKAYQPQGRLLGLDIGKKNIGISLSDAQWCIASPLTVISDARFLKVVQLLQQYSTEYHITLVIVGLPLNMNGDSGPQCQWVKQYVHNLERKLYLPFFFQDERLSTKAAYRPLVASKISAQKRAAAVDKVAACYILQTALDRRKSDLIHKN